MSAPEHLPVPAEGFPQPWRRRGACPSLMQPMQTGDGLLGRLNPVEGALSAAQLAGVARAALAHGNGVIEITARASLQIRGLTETSAPALGEAIAALGLSVRNGLLVETGPLAGVDVSAAVDPRPLARELRRRAAAAQIEEKLGPKVRVAIDDGGMPPSGATGADVHLEAVATGAGGVRWRVRTGTRMVDGLTPDRATALALSILQAIAGKGREARGRDLAGTDFAAIASEGLGDATPVERPSPPPVGVFPLVGGQSAHGVALPFGQTRAGSLLAVALAAKPDTEMRLAPSGLLAIGLTPAGANRWLAVAAAHGLVVGRSDPRLSIRACAGAPACGAAHLDTKALAAAVSRLPGVAGNGVRVHVFGCGKQCARPAAPAVTLTGHASGCSVAADGIPLNDGTKAALLDLASLHRTTIPA